MSVGVLRKELAQVRCVTPPMNEGEKYSLVVFREEGGGLLDDSSVDVCSDGVLDRGSESRKTIHVHFIRRRERLILKY